MRKFAGFCLILVMAFACAFLIANTVSFFAVEPELTLVPTAVDYSDEEIFSLDQKVTAMMQRPAIYRSQYQYLRNDGTRILVGVAGVGDELWPVEVELTDDGQVFAWLVMENMPKGFSE